MSFLTVYFWLLSSSLHARMRLSVLILSRVTQWCDEANTHYGGHRLDVTIRIDVRRCEGVFILLYQRMLHPMSLTGMFQLTPNAISFRQGFPFFLRHNIVTHHRLRRGEEQKKRAFQIAANQRKHPSRANAAHTTPFARCVLLSEYTLSPHTYSFPFITS